MSGELPEKETVRGDVTKPPRDKGANVDKRAATAPAPGMAQPAQARAAEEKPLVETAETRPATQRSATASDVDAAHTPQPLDVPANAEDMRRVPGA